MKWQLKSKTMHAGVVTIVWGILILFGFVEGPPPQTINQLGQKQSNNSQTAIGLGALASGLTALKGRSDAQKRIKEGEDES